MKTSCKDALYTVAANCLGRRTLWRMIAALFTNNITMQLWISFLTVPVNSGTCLTQIELDQRKQILLTNFFLISFIIAS
jgi:hypothetical protein